jgi:PAS domain S-box-containing protein
LSKSGKRKTISIKDKVDKAIKGIKSGKPLIDRDLIKLLEDIAELNPDPKFQTELEERERKYSTLVSNLPGFVYRCSNDKNWTIHFISDGCKKITGYSPADFINNKKIAFNDLIHPDYQKRIWKKWQQTLKDKTYFEFEYPITAKNGQLKWVWERGRGVYSDAGKPIFLEGFIEDISEKRNAEETAKLKNIVFESSIAANSIANLDGKIIDVNFAFLVLWGYKKKTDVLGKSLSVFLKSKNDVESILTALNKNGKWQGDYTAVRKDKSEFIAHGLATTVVDEFGKVIGYQSSVLDVTDRHKTDELLRQSELSYRGLFDSVSESIYIQDENGVFLDVNAGASLMYGYDKKTLIGKTPEFVSAPGKNDLESVGVMVSKAFAGEKHQFEFWGKRKNGEEFLKDVRLYPGTYFNKKVTIAIATDITEQKKVQQLLRESEERYRAISTLTSDYLFSTKADENGVHNIVWIAGSFEKITGYTFEEYLKIGGWRATLHPDELEPDNLDLEQLKRNEKVNRQIRVYHKDGSLRWVRSSAQPVWDKINNKLIGINGAVEDITEQKQTEIIQKIQYNIADAAVTSRTLTDLIEIIRQELSEIINVKNFFIAFYDEKTGMLKSDVDKDEVEEIAEWPAKGSMTGYVIEQGKSALLTKNEINQLIKIGKAGMVGTIPEIWLGVPFKIGGKVFGALVVQSYDNPNAYDKRSIEILEIVAHELSIFIDHKKAEEETLKLSTAVVQSPTIVIITDLDGNIEFVNPKFSEVTGYSIEEAKWKNPRILNSGFHDKKFFSDLWQTILSGKIWQGEIRNKKKNGDLYWENVLISPITDSNGKITHFVAVKEDITEKKKMIEELIRAKENAEEMNRIKSSFFANMSHELRTPMMGILGFSEILMHELKDSPDYLRMISSINASGQRLLETLNLILNLSKLEASKMEVSLKTQNIIPILKECFGFFESAAANKTIDYKFVSQYDEIHCNVDQLLFASVFNNLLNNAIKFTDSGSVTLGVFIDSNYVNISVIDTGVGISEAKQNLIWDEFRQASEGYNRVFEGTGLGLTIAKRYTDLMHGSIMVKSLLGKGTTFRVSFPIANKSEDLIGANKKDQPNKSEKSENTNSAARILYVEDDEISIKYVTTVTKSLYTVDSAPDSDDALNKIKQHKYDAILMDINLRKGMDGIELTKVIRKIDGYQSTPIVAITAFAMGHEKEEFLSKGMTHYLSKPYVKNQLLSLLASIVDKKQ